MNIYHQSVFDTWPLEDKSAQTIITSPPYWGLRKYNIPDVVIGGDINCKHWFDTHDLALNIYCTYCGAWQGQYGLEPSYKDFIEHTRLWCREAWRVLKDDGIFFLNIGDSYCGGGRGTDKKFGEGRDEQPKSFKGDETIKSKCKMLIPHRIAIALIEDGWILRNDIIWAKGNPMPESVKDRFSKGFEYIFMFVKQEKYYFDLDAVREVHSYVPKFGDKVTTKSKAFGIKEYGGQVRNNHDIHNCYNPKDKNPSDVWTINTQPSGEAHFAMWPEKLVKRMILCSTKPGDAVFDPFVGSGTTIKVAEELNRVGSGIDLGYKDIQVRRLNNIQKTLI